MGFSGPGQAFARQAFFPALELEAKMKLSHPMHWHKAAVHLIILCIFLAGPFSGVAANGRSTPARAGTRRATRTEDQPWFYVWMTKDGELWDIHGYKWPADTPVTLTVDNPPLTPGTPDFTRVAYMEVPPWSGDAQLVYDISGMWVVPGAVVTMTDGLTANLTHIVPPLHVSEVNALTDQVRGTSEAGTTVQVGVQGLGAYRDVTVADDGTWLADFSQPGDEPGELVADLAPGQTVVPSQSNGGGTTAVPWFVPFLVYLPVVMR
jgi:hypothetical protein